VETKLQINKYYNNSILNTDKMLYFLLVEKRVKYENDTRWGSCKSSIPSEKKEILDSET